MKYIIQVNTGNIKTQNYDAKQIIKRIEYLREYLDISRVIFGWHNNKKDNQEICEYLHSKNIEAYFWLPVFAEIIDLDYEDKYVENDLFAKKSAKLSEGDNFEFVCQSSNSNINYIINEFSKINEDVKFDGVFLDRIRYKSPALALDALYGCLCDNCKKIYKDIKIDKDIFEKLIPSKIVEGIYEYDDDNLNKLMKTKRDIITSQINKLYTYFKNKNLKVGLDTFALCLGDFVGQDIVSLSKYCDFIKPMFYLKTTAPAGIPFELAGLPANTKEAINKLWGKEVTSIESSINQCEYLLKRNIHITPGIDVNNIKDICNSDEDYVIEYIEQLANIDCNEIVLSWDSMKITNSLLKKVKTL